MGYPMFGSVGGPEIVLIFIVALIVFGPHQLPEIGRKVGGLVREFRKATSDFRSSVEREIGFDPITGMELTRKARRDILTTVSEPIREVAEGARSTLREAKTETGALLENLKGAPWKDAKDTQAKDAPTPAVPPQPSPAGGTVSRSDDPEPVPSEEGPKG